MASLRELEKMDRAPGLGRGAGWGSEVKGSVGHIQWKELVKFKWRWPVDQWLSK